MSPLITTRLTLDPLLVTHAAAMFEVLADAALYRYLDYPPPPSIEHLRDVYTRWQKRKSPDGSQHWLNWVIRPHGETPIGYVQATVVAPQTAWVAYVLSHKYGGHGYATEATQAMIDHLACAYDVIQCLATVEVENLPSIRLLERLGFRAANPDELKDHDLTATERLYLRSAA